MQNFHATKFEHRKFLDQHHHFVGGQLAVLREVLIHFLTFCCIFLWYQNLLAANYTGSPLPAFSKALIYVAKVLKIIDPTKHFLNFFRIFLPCILDRVNPTIS